MDSQEPLARGKEDTRVRATGDQAKPQVLPGDSQEMGELEWNSEKPEEEEHSRTGALCE